MKAGTKGRGRKARTTAPKPENLQPRRREVAGPDHYTGAPLKATRVLTRRMSEFSKTTADCLLIIDSVGGVYHFANTYRAGILPRSYDPDKYRYKLDEKSLKRLEAKIEKQGYIELERPDWPEWVTPAVKKRERKTPQERRRTHEESHEQSNHSVPR
jgi:hypothetical protein